MGRRRLVRPAALLAGALLVAACSSPAPIAVRSTRSDALPTLFDRDVPLTDVEALPDIDAAAWGPCDEQASPWQCAVIEVPLDYRRVDSGEPPVEIALTRLPASEPDSRIGSLVLNPGGPGGSGVSLAWGFASSFPQEVLDTFDLVGFDPRGVGRSTAVDCGDLDRAYEAVLRDCVSNSGDLLPYIGTQNSARDLEMIRKAVGDEQLTYVGFSYGTILGAAYADLFPDSVRALVLDGSTDPDAGLYNVDGTVVSSFGVPFYGVQDFYATATVFFELCDSTRLCPAGPTTEDLVDELWLGTSDLPIDYFDGWEGEEFTEFDLQGVLISSMYSTDLWPPLALALADAEAGDASTLAAMASFLEAGYPRQNDDFDNLAAANVAIYCADFAGRSGRFDIDECTDFPETAEPLAPVTAVDVDTPIVVIGTDGDPATPGFLAPRMADALGDAVSIRWEGAGHTAFLNSACVDELVVDYLVDLVVPDDRARCTFTNATNTGVARAEFVFDVLEDPQRWITRLASVFEAEGEDPDMAACIAEALVDDGDPAVVMYARFGVQRDVYVDARAAAEQRCD